MSGRTREHSACPSGALAGTGVMDLKTLYFGIITGVVLCWRPARGPDNDGVRRGGSTAAATTTAAASGRGQDSDAAGTPGLNDRRCSH